MTNQDKATLVFNRVRDRYRSGLKSSNKNYEEDDVSEEFLPKRRASNMRVLQAGAGKGAQGASFGSAFVSQPVRQGASDAAEMGRTLWTISANILNCSELANMAG